MVTNTVILRFCDMAMMVTFVCTTLYRSHVVTVAHTHMYSYTQLQVERDQLESRIDK